MSGLSDYELLQLIYKHVNLDTLKSQNNSITREALDNLFSKLFEYIKRGMESASPPPTHSPSPLSSPPRGEGWGEGRDRVGGYETLIIHSDGASRGNPGKAGIGIVIFDGDGRKVEEISEYIGETTNNVAEYKSLITAAKRALEYGVKEVIFKVDSELIVKQIYHKYRVKAPHIIPLYRELQGMLVKFQKWEVIHVPREENFCADALANMGIDSSGDR